MNIKINKLSKILIILVIVLFITTSFMLYITQYLRTNNNKLKLENDRLKFDDILSDEIINDLVRDEEISELVIEKQSQLLNKIFKENIELTKELKNLKEN